MDEFEDRINDLQNFVSDINKEIEEISIHISEVEAYPGGDPLGTEYVKRAELEGLNNDLARKNAHRLVACESLCSLYAIKLKSLAVTFYGKNANDNFDVEKVSAQLREAFANNNEVDLRMLNDAINCADEMSPAIVIEGENEEGASFEYEIDIMSNGIDINQSTVEKKYD